MSEIRDQLICYLQQLIDKRLSDNTHTLAGNLVGFVSQFKPFVHWLQNNFKFDLKYNILKLIQEDSHHFHYDFNTGFITNNNLFDGNRSPVLNPIVLKPKLFNDLEINDWSQLDPIDDNVLVLELILFVVEEVTTQSIVVSDLLLKIEEKCDKQFNCFKSKFEPKIKSESTKSDNQRALLHLMINHLKSIFSFDSSEQILTINRNETELFEVWECFIKTSEIVIKNCLIRQLYRFGRRTSLDLKEWLKKKYEIIFEFLVKQNLTLDQIIGLYPEEFVVRIDETNENVIDLNPIIIGKTRSLEFELMYKYGTEIRGGFGVVNKVTENSAKIESQIEFIINGQNFRPEFVVISESVNIYGHEVSDLRTFIHSGDTLYFDVQFITTFDDIWSVDCSDYLWLVSRIFNVRHMAICYVQTVFGDWTDIQWNSDDDDSGSDDSTHNGYEDNSSDFD